MARSDHVVLVNQPGQQFKARIADGLHEKLKAAAKANNRSANAELVSRLEASFLPTAAVLEGAVAATINQYVEAEVRRRLTAIASQIGGEA